MCGIAGFISTNKHYNGSEIVRRMLAKIQHRGPDQAGVASYHDVTLGMARLSIIDCERHTIPYTDESDNFAIVYNGEIYNHDSIKAPLVSKYHFKTNSDTEVALISFIDKGIEALIDFNGMYALAVYNKQSRETFIARDKTGEKPLYYTQGKDFFAFASEMKALLEVTEPRINKKAMSYKAYEFTVGKETLFQDIYQLEPGEYLKIKGQNVSIHSYWKIWDNLIEVANNDKSVIADLSELVEDAITLRTKNCAHQFAAFVSGGVDSALVACIAKPEHIYTAHYEYPDFDELRYAQMVAKQINKELHIIKPTRDDFLKTKNDISYSLDTPCTWTSFTLWMLLKELHKDGLRVVLSGDGADEMFGGYHRYHLLCHDEQIRNLEAMNQYDYLINKYYGSPVERYAKLVNRCDNIYNESVIRYLHETIGYYFEKMDEDVIHLMGLNDFYSTMQVLLQMADRMSMAFNIENRSPFLDYRLVQYAFSMPSKYKIRHGIAKWILKEVARKFIPAPIVERIDKRGFSAPVNKWFQWEKNGKYDRSGYRHTVLQDWKKSYNIIDKSA